MQLTRKRKINFYLFHVNFFFLIVVDYHRLPFGFFVFFFFSSFNFVERKWQLPLPAQVVTHASFPTLINNIPLVRGGGVAANALKRKLKFLTIMKIWILVNNFFFHFLNGRNKNFFSPEEKYCFILSKLFLKINFVDKI